MKAYRLSRFLVYRLASLIFILLLASVGCGGGGSGGGGDGGTATLTWNAPTRNVDGSDLVDLQGYKIYYGIVGNSDFQPFTTIPIELTDSRLNCTSGSCTFTVNFSSSYGWVCFAVSAYDADGNESELSNILTLINTTTCKQI